MDVVTNDIYWILSFDMDQAKRAHLSIYPQILCSHVFIWIQRIKVMWPMRIFTYSSVWPRGRQLRLWLYDWSDISNPASFAEAGRRSRGLKKCDASNLGSDAVLQQSKGKRAFDNSSQLFCSGSKLDFKRKKRLKLRPPSQFTTFPNVFYSSLKQFRPKLFKTHNPHITHTKYSSLYYI